MNIPNLGDHPRPRKTRNGWNEGVIAVNKALVGKGNSTGTVVATKAGFVLGKGVHFVGCGIAFLPWIVGSWPS